MMATVPHVTSGLGQKISGRWIFVDTSVQEASWITGPVWTGTENLARTGIRSPGRPAHSGSQYQLRYPATR